MTFSSQEDARGFCGGYRVTTRVKRDDAWMGTDLLPPTFVTSTDCLASLVPDFWAFSWNDHDEKVRARALSAFGLPERRLPELQAWVEEASGRKDVLWPNTFASVAAAKAFRDRFCQGALVLGFGLDEAFRQLVLSEDPNNAPLYDFAREGRRLEDGGRNLGFEVVGWSPYGHHSFLCNHLWDLFAERIGARPNADGLYDDEAQARQCAALAGDPATPAEEDHWRAWRVVAF